MDNILDIYKEFRDFIEINKAVIEQAESETALSKKIRELDNEFQCEFSYPILGKPCDLKHEKKSIWLEIKNNTTLLPICTSKFITVPGGHIFLDIARLIAGVNSTSDYRLVLTKIDKRIIEDYYRFGISLPKDKESFRFFSADDVLPVKGNRNKFVEMKLAAEIRMDFIACDKTYILIIQVLGGHVTLFVYKNVTDNATEGDCMKIMFMDDNKLGSQFIRDYFPST